MIVTTKYIRKPFEVEAIQVTDENMANVAIWCEGALENDKQPYIRVKVARVLNDRQTKAYTGDWILYGGTGFKVYTNKAFLRSFEQKDATKIVHPIDHPAAKSALDMPAEDPKEV